jgi:saccharopine dehydrogenase-like NADP-dependent oxidoreductase
VKEKGLIFFNEVGLDPGIDIMSSMKIKEDVEAEGGKIISYESWCGGLPDAACAGDNPLFYKFSWAPQAVFNTSKNSCTFLRDNQVVTLDGKDLLTLGTSPKNFHPAYKIEGYPNRDSLSFKDQFAFNDAHTFIRGTLRYEGFGVIMRALH